MTRTEGEEAVAAAVEEHPSNSSTASVSGRGSEQSNGKLITHRQRVKSHPARGHAREIPPPLPSETAPKIKVVPFDGAVIYQSQTSRRVWSRPASSPVSNPAAATVNGHGASVQLQPPAHPAAAPVSSQPAAPPSPVARPTKPTASRVAAPGQGSATHAAARESAIKTEVPRHVSRRSTVRMAATPKAAPKPSHPAERQSNGAAAANDPRRDEDDCSDALSGGPVFARRNTQPPSPSAVKADPHQSRRRGREGTQKKSRSPSPLDAISPTAAKQKARASPATAKKTTKRTDASKKPNAAGAADNAPQKRKKPSKKTKVSKSAAKHHGKSATGAEESEAHHRHLVDAAAAVVAEAAHHNALESPKEHHEDPVVSVEADAHVQHRVATPVENSTTAVVEEEKPVAPAEKAIEEAESSIAIEEDANGPEEL